MSKPVHEKYLFVHRKALGIDPIVDKILTDPESAEGKMFVQAKAIYTNKLKRQYVEASLLASNDIPKICSILELPIDLITFYRDFFYDVVGLDKLSKLELLKVSDKEEALLKLWTVSQGLSFIEWRLGGKVIVNPVEGLQDLFTTCWYKSKEAMFNPNSTKASQESTKYIKLAMDLARLLKIWVMDSSAAKKDIELALQSVLPEFRGLDSLEEDMQASIMREKKESGDDDDDGDESESSDGSVDTSVNVVTEFSLDDLMKENERE